MMRRLLFLPSIVWTLFFFDPSTLFSQTQDPFECAPGFYQVISGQLNVLNPSEGTYAAIGPAHHTFTNMAFNPDDNFLYAIKTQNGTETDALGNPVSRGDLFRMDKDGEIFFVKKIGYWGHTGEVSNGKLWVKDTDTQFAVVDLNTLGIGYYTLNGSMVPRDMAKVGNYMYGAHADGTGQVNLYVLNMETLDVDTYPISGMNNASFASSQSFGASFIANSIELYVTHNGGQGLWQIKDFFTSTPSGEFRTSTVTTSNNDGSSCPQAPYPVAGIGTAMQATVPTPNGDGTYTVNFTVTAQNWGNMAFYDLEMVDNVTSPYGVYTASTPTSPGTYTISTAPVITSNTTVPFSANPDFTGDRNGSGTADNNLILIGTGGVLDGYPVAESVTVTYSVRFYPQPDRSFFCSQYYASGDFDDNGVATAEIRDFSTDGTNPDPDANNNPADNFEKTCVNINEICNNGIDDDGDGFIDCEDNDCVENAECGGPGGAGGGGLESNDNLASKIAERAYKRTISNIDLEDKAQLQKIVRSDNYGAFEISFRNEFDIAEFMPIDIFEDGESFDASPTDLVDITNATQVVGTDYFEGDRRRAAVLGVKSDGVYEHAKYVCDRVKGAEIRDIFKHKIDGTHNFIITYFKNRYGNIEYNTNISLYLDANQNFVLESFWDLDEYRDDRTYYNFQIWARGLSSLETLTNEIIDLIEAKAPISSYAFSAIPRVYAKSLYYDNEGVLINLKNNAGAKEITLRGSGLKHETSERTDFEHTIELDGSAEQQIRVSTEGLYSFGADIVHSDEEVVDVVFTADGFWGLAYQAQETDLNSWDVQESYHKQDATLRDGSWIERNVHVNASASNYVTVYRSMNPAFRTEDFSDFNTLTFEAEGSGELEVVIIKSGIDRMEDQMHLTYTLDGSCKKVFLHRDYFENYQIWNDVQMIYFTQKNPAQGAKTTIDLKLSNVAFINAEKGHEDCQDFNLLQVEAFPNPTTGLINFKLPRPDLAYDFVLTNQLGQIILKQAGAQVFDSVLRIDKELQSGLYHYQFTLDSGVYSGKFLVTE